jgi:hypothetical protein
MSIFFPNNYYLKIVTIEEMNDELIKYCKRKYKGIQYLSQTDLWRARIYLNGRKRFLGDFDSPDIALNYVITVKNFHRTHPDIPGSEIRKILFPKIRQTKQGLNSLRIAMLNAYGPYCHCCKESNIHFLTLEHVNGDGATHRKTLGKNRHGVLIDLRERGWPTDGYTVLCMNCNWGSRRTQICPHNVIPKLIENSIIPVTTMTQLKIAPIEKIENHVL